MANRPKQLRSSARLLGATALCVGTICVAGGARASAATTPPPPPPPAGAVIVGSCSDEGTYNTIQAAVDAATTGETIYVCPGTYDESVRIDKDVNLLGAQFDEPANDESVRTDPTMESIIDAPVAASGNSTSPINYTTGVGGEVSGFTLEGANANNADAVAGISALYGAGGGSFDWTNNIVTDNGEGIQFNTQAVASAYSATSPMTTISGNRFVTNNNDSADGKSGSGIFISNGLGDNVTITENTFDDNGGTNGDVNTTGSGACTDPTATADLSQGLTISDNDSIHNPGYENNFAVLFCTEGAQVTGNTVTYPTPIDGNADSAIYVGGGNTNLTVSANQLQGGSGGAGISFNSDFYPEGTGDAFTDNIISGHSNGIVVRGSQTETPNPAPTSFQITGNTITNSVFDGIRIEGGASAGTISANSASTSGTYDCEDDTTGSGTAGTADTWSADSGSTSSPAGLCTAAPPSALPEVAAPVVLPLAAAGVFGGAFLIRRRRNRLA